jgi:hypothetical protein
MQSINGDCLNIGNLSGRYEAFCRQLIQVPDKRFAELLGGQICAGLFKCTLAISTRSKN